MSYIRAFVPLKHPACARHRLLEALTAKQRHSMYFTLARRIITALRDVPLVRDTLIVTSSAEVEIFAGHLGVRVMHQMRDEGINSACEAAIAASCAGSRPLIIGPGHPSRDGPGVACDASSCAGSRPLIIGPGHPSRDGPGVACDAPSSAVRITNALIIAGDLPLVCSESLTALLQGAHLQERGVTIVPDRRHVGTNALVCTPADAIRLRFGPNSFAAHLRTAQEHGLEARIFESSELALDIDEPEDLDAWRGYDSRNQGLGHPGLGHPGHCYGGDRRESTSIASSRGGLPGNRLDGIVRPG